MSTTAMKHVQKGLEFLGASGVAIGAGSLLTGILISGTVASLGSEALCEFFEGLAEEGFWGGMDRATDAVLERVSDAGNSILEHIGNGLAVVWAYWPF